jgi:PIN domain nuclease of toxin-antitoxin system
MRYLLDTHIFFWSAFETQKLSKQHAELLLSESVFYVSMVSFWELAIKKSLDKLDAPDDFLISLQKKEITMLPLSMPHVLRIGALPYHHRDPFDRMLIAQAQAEGLTLLTMDKEMKKYSDIITLL